MNNHRLKRAIATLCLPYLLALPAAAPAGESTRVPTTADPAAVAFLLSSAAKDFKIAATPRPTAIRQAHVGYFHESGRGNYVLCGAFRSGDAADAPWTSFATIQTSDYEQWHGGMAQAFCTADNVRWYDGDYADVLMQRLSE